MRLKHELDAVAQERQRHGFRLQRHYGRTQHKRRSSVASQAEYEAHEHDCAAYTDRGEAALTVALLILGEIKNGGQDVQDVIRAEQHRVEPTLKTLCRTFIDRGVVAQAFRALDSHDLGQALDRCERTPYLVRGGSTRPFEGIRMKKDFIILPRG